MDGLKTGASIDFKGGLHVRVNRNLNVIGTNVLIQH
jgi:hypothetical protein